MIQSTTEGLLTFPRLKGPVIHTRWCQAFLSWKLFLCLMFSTGTSQASRLATLRAAADFAQTKGKRFIALKIKSNDNSYLVKLCVQAWTRRAVADSNSNIKVKPGEVKLGETRTLKKRFHFHPHKSGSGEVPTSPAVFCKADRNRISLSDWFIHLVWERTDREQRVGVRRWNWTENMRRSETEAGTD